MSRYIMLFVLLTGSFLILNAQQKYIFRGRVADSLTQEPLAGATLLISDDDGTITNNQGSFTIRTKKLPVHLTISYLGYETKIMVLTDAGNDINILLVPEVIYTEEVRIVAQNPNNNIETTSTGKITLTQKDIHMLPALMGEVDLMRAIQLTPGIQAANEGNSGFYVRGGGVDQNMVLLDNATVYNPSHVLGFFSVFNGDAVREVNLIKSGIPADYGGRLSSVLDVKSFDGDPENYSLKGSIGLISSRMTLHGPIIKNKATLLVSGRRTYIDEVVKPLLKPVFEKGASFINNSKYHFYDMNVRLFLKPSVNDLITFTVYHGNDMYKLSKVQLNYKNQMEWGNTLYSFNLNHRFGNTLYFQQNISYSKYVFDFFAFQNEVTISMLSAIDDINLKSKFIKITKTGLYKFGIDYCKHKFRPNNLDVTASEIGLDFNSNRNLYSHEFAPFFLHEIELSQRIKLTYGLRFSGFIHVGPYALYERNIQNVITDTTSYASGEKVVDYYGWEPRITARYRLNENSAIKASYSRHYQYVHLATASNVTVPLDAWLPSTPVIKPQRGDHFAIGYYRNINENRYITSAEIYYKAMDNQVELLYGLMNNFADNTFDESVTFGKGRAYGTELYIRKVSGKLQGWIGYTLSRTEKEFEEINEGNIYPAKYDRTHDFNVLVSYDLNDKVSFTATFIYATGNAYTLPVSKYLITSNLVTEYGETNAFRMPAYHRMDLSVNYIAKKTDKFESVFSASVYNVYSRANPFYIYFVIEGDPQSSLTVQANQISLFPILPSITWSFKF